VLQIKKIRLQLDTDAYAEWERENLGEVKISLDGIPHSDRVVSGAS